MNNTTKLIILFLSLLMAGNTNGQWTRYIKNYDKAIYGRGAQMWQIAPHQANQWTFFANQNGMVQFDGTEWNLFPLNNSHYTRSVCISQRQGRVYVGGINEYGYFEPSNNGALQYHCISDTLQENLQVIGNVWNIAELSTSIVFQGDNNIVRLTTNDVTLIETHKKIDCSTVLNDVVYFGTDQGVFLLAGNSLYPLPDGDVLIGKRIRCMTPYDKGLLIATAYNGLYYNDGQHTSHIDTDADGFLAANELFCAAVNDNYIALGTIQKGIIIIDKNNGTTSYYNEDNGLQNNTVLSMAFDGLGNLWAGLDSGTDYIYLNLPYTNLYTSRNSVGTGYAATIDGQRLLLGTNRGLYYTDYKTSLKGITPKLNMIEHSGGQVWNLCHIGNELFCLHDRGLFLVNNNQLKRIGDIGGAWNCQLVIGTNDSLYVGTYGGLFLVCRRNNSWHVSHRIEGADDSFQTFEQDDNHSIWLHNGKSVSLLTLKSDLQNVESRREFTEADGLPHGAVTNLAKINGRVYFLTTNGIYKFNHHRMMFEPATEINNILGGSKPYFKATVNNSYLVSLSDNEICMCNINPNKHNAKAITTPIQQTLISLVPNYTTIIPLSDSLYIIPTDKGFTLFNTADVSESNCHNHAFHIKSMTSTSANDTLVYKANFLNTKNHPVLTYTANSVRFDYEAGIVCTNNVLYRYRLSGSPWSEPSLLNAKEFSGLKEGDYKFEVEAITGDNTTESDSISFTILPPWYRSTWAYLFYMACLCFIIWLIYSFDRRRINNKERIVVEEKDKEMAAKEIEFVKEKERQERQIMQLEKEKLEFDLQHKSQEMANLMINFVRKNEMLTDIKVELNKVASSLKAGNAREGSRQIILLNSKIDSNIQNDDVLKRIEEQFDIIHNNFMKKLSAKHPDLSNNERMMCAYLKMNLSTKEIAPLLNISIRGVETMRYRLRKKFNLEREDGLITYLNEEFS